MQKIPATYQETLPKGVSVRHYRYTSGSESWCKETKDRVSLEQSPVITKENGKWSLWILRQRGANPANTESPIGIEIE